MIIRHARGPRSSEITPRDVYLDRRRFMLGAAAVVATPVVGMPLTAPAAATLRDVAKSPFSTDEEPTDKEDVTSYNNFYELGTDKSDPAKNAHLLKTEPWTVTIGGECAKPGKVSFDDLVRPHQLEERVYRLRCVEAWSMVVPWVGVPLAKVLERFEPTSRAKYVAFTTIMDPENLPGQRWPILDWPYREGLRIDEAMHPLTLLAVGLYGETLPGQNGAPVRLVVPWKYGFKSIKSIVAIDFVETQPKTAWNTSAPHEYGFYANVNPNVDHPRWSQARERRIGHFFKQDTLMFNGYADEVAHLYAGMDLTKQF